MHLRSVLRTECLAANQLPVGKEEVLRLVAKLGGAWVGATVGHAESKIKKYVGLGILSQAGVAIGLSLIIKHDVAEMVKDPKIAAAVTKYHALHEGTANMLYSPVMMGAALLTTVTATCIVFEIVGPILTKIALTKAGEISPDS
jgi:hypothetical protein